jgi:very-short-patch-repair endonuclease
MTGLRKVWDKTNKVTMVTKFEQDVLENLRKLPLTYEKNRNEKETGLEVDMIVSEYKGKKVKIAIEVNGVFHYPRNSEEPLGKDVIKRRVIEKNGYKVITIPYY